jgi:hypothetical protein
MSATIIPTMIIEDVELCVQPSLTCHGDPINCDHLWVPHPRETNHACCTYCGSRARWINAPYAREKI